MENEFRIHITIRRRGESIADSVEIRTEECSDREELYDNAINFIEGGIISLIEEGSEDEN